MDAAIKHGADVVMSGKHRNRAGIKLTVLIANAKNRSVANILFTNFRAAPAHKKSKIDGELKPTRATGAGIFMCYAKEVIIAPSYGLAAAQGQ